MLLGLGFVLHKAWKLDYAISRETFPRLIMHGLLFSAQQRSRLTLGCVEPLPRASMHFDQREAALAADLMKLLIFKQLEQSWQLKDPFSLKHAHASSLSIYFFPKGFSNCDPAELSILIATLACFWNGVLWSWIFSAQLRSQGPTDNCPELEKCCFLGIWFASSAILNDLKI